MHDVVVLKPPDRVDPLEEVWLTHEVCQVDGVYVDESGHWMTLHAGSTFPSSQSNIGLPTRYRLALFITK